MAEPVGVALVGTGMWGRQVAYAARRTSGLELLACYSPDEGRRAAFAAEFGCTPAPSLEAAIEAPGVRGVLLVTPNYLHLEGALACAERGRHVFVEKPIADRAEDGLKMKAACEAAGVALMVGHCFRRLGAARRVKALLEEGLLGKVVLAEANLSLPGSLTPDRWRYYRSTCPGGPLMQLGIHHADTLQYWLGPVAGVQGTFAHLATSAEIDDVGLAALEFAEGARGSLASSYVSPKSYSARLYGTKGVLSYIVDMSVWPKAELLDQKTSLELQTKNGSRQIAFKERDMLADELEEFSRCVRGEAEPETGPEQALAALGVVMAAIRSYETGRKVAIGELLGERTS